MPHHLPFFQNNPYVAEADNTRVNIPDLSNIQIAEVEEEEYVDKFGSTSGSIYPSGPEKTLWEKIKNAGANPLATFGYAVRGEDVPWGNVPRHENPFDTYALGLINPFAWGESGEAAVGEFKQGNILGGILETAGALPVIPAGIGAAKKLLPQTSSILSKATKGSVSKTKATDLKLVNKSPEPTSVSNINTYGAKDIKNVVLKRKTYLLSDEYITKRMANTGESRNQVKAQIDAYLKELDNTTMGMYKEGDLGKSIYGDYGSKGIRITNARSYEEILDAIDHEVGHLLSPVNRSATSGNPHTNILWKDLKTGKRLTDAEAKVYKKDLDFDPNPKWQKWEDDYAKLYENYPSIKMSTGNAKMTRYLNDPAEQQVRMVRYGEILKKHGWDGTKKGLTNDIINKTAGKMQGKIALGIENSAGNTLPSDVRQLLGNMKGIDVGSPQWYTQIKKTLPYAWGMVPIAATTTSNYEDGTDVESSEQTWLQKLTNPIRKRLAENIYPESYMNPKERIVDALKGKKHWMYQDVLKDHKQTGELYTPRIKERIDLLQMVMGQDQTYNTIEESKYKPTKGKDDQSTIQYYRSPHTENALKHIIKVGGWNQKDLREGVQSRSNKRINTTFAGGVLGEYTINYGEDENGEYISYYDKWDLEPFKEGTFLDNISEKVKPSLGINSPEIYGRIYKDEIDFEKTEQDIPVSGIPYDPTLYTDGTTVTSNTLPLTSFQSQETPYTDLNWLQKANYGFSESMYNRPLTTGTPPIVGAPGKFKKTGALINMAADYMPKTVSSESALDAQINRQNIIAEQTGTTSTTGSQGVGSGMYMESDVFQDGTEVTQDTVKTDIPVIDSAVSAGTAIGNLAQDMLKSKSTEIDWDNLYNSIEAREHMGHLGTTDYSSMIRTKGLKCMREGTCKGSTAYGPIQITKTKLEDLNTPGARRHYWDDPTADSPKEGGVSWDQDYVDKFIEQSRLFSKWGGMDMPTGGIDPKTKEDVSRYGYGKSGDLTTEEDIKNYKNLGIVLLKGTRNALKSKLGKEPTLEQIVSRWRTDGVEPEYVSDVIYYYKHGKFPEIKKETIQKKEDGGYTYAQNNDSSNRYLQSVNSFNNGSQTISSSPRDQLTGWLSNRKRYLPTGVNTDADTEMVYWDKHNTELNKEEERDFLLWATTWINPGTGNLINPLDQGTYDIKGFWKSGDWEKTDDRGHGSDTWKKPNHPSFSEASIYSKQKGGSDYEGGTWMDDGAFLPGFHNMHNNDRLLWEFSRDEGPEHLLGDTYMLPEVNVTP